jgi:sulfotransferase 6B1
MSSNFVQSKLLRTVGIAVFRTRSRMIWWKNGPRAFLNSIPKAGSHLLIAELERLGGIDRSMLHVETRSVNRLGRGREHIAEVEVDIDRFDRQARTVRNSQYFTAHLPWSDELSQYLADHGFRTIYLMRDPRAILVSNCHYIMGLRRHHLHSFLSGLPDDEARYRALLLGKDDLPQIPSMRLRLEAYGGWTADPSVLTIRFEDLIGAQGGGSVESKEQALRAVANHVGLDSNRIADLAQSRAGRTATLREGKAHSWSGKIPSGILDLMREECGELCAAYGYSLD